MCLSLITICFSLPFFFIILDFFLDFNIFMGFFLFSVIFLFLLLHHYFPFSSPFLPFNFLSLIQLTLPFITLSPFSLLFFSSSLFYLPFLHYVPSVILSSLISYPLMQLILLHYFIPFLFFSCPSLLSSTSFLIFSL